MSNLEQQLYEVITNNIDYLIDESADLTFKNIKESTINILLYYNVLNDNTLISENDFFNYFKNAEESTIGRFFQALLVTTDVVAGTVSSGVGVNSYISTLFLKTFGASSFSTITGGIVSGFGPLLLIVIAFFIYKKISKNEVLNVLNMVRSIDKLSKILKFPIDSRLNTEFKDLIKNKCNIIDDKNLKIECAITGYSKFLNEFVLNELVVKYVQYLKNNNEELSNIVSFNELATFKSQSNRSVSVLMNRFYYSYIRFLNGLNINKSIIGDNFRFLNNITKNALKVY